MSRSYKYPVFKDHSGKFGKRASNKKLRQTLKTLSIGFKSSKFKKTLFEPWNICDWKWYPTDEIIIIKARRK